jgi:hypothetical protein
MADAALKSPVKVGKRFRRGPKGQAFAKVIATFFAKVARLALDPDFEGNPRADLDGGDALANCGDDP